MTPPLFAAQVPNVSATCGKVTELRTEYGDLVVMIEVAAFMITMNFFACAETSAAASAFGREHEAGRARRRLSRTTSSCASRLATSGAGPPMSLRMISIFLPATVSPCCFM